MQLYNVEVFSQDFKYKSSNQCVKTNMDIDYLSISNSQVVLPDIRASEGDYVRISGHGMRYTAIVTSCKDTDSGFDLQFKPMLAITDVDIHYTKDGITESLEQWIADLLNENFKNNGDALQNITGFTAVAGSTTEGAILDLETNIGNLYQILTEVFVKYGIVVNFEINLQKKTLDATVEKVAAEKVTIEADLQNVIARNFIIKQADQTVNKMIIYNDLDESQQIIFYLLSDGSISEDAEAAGRITPVVFSTEYVTFEEPEEPAEEEETFHDVAYERAFSRMSLPEYNNLIELEIMNDDELIRPESLTIGQQSTIIRNGTAYQTLLTGKKIGDTTTLVFGAVRLELTKKMKRRLQK